MNVGIKLEGIERALRVFDPRKAERAIKYAINDTARQTRTAASDSIRKGQKYNIKKRDLDAKIKAARFATTGRLEAVLEARGRSVGLKYFGAKQTRHLAKGSRVQTGTSGRQTKRRSRTASGVTVQIIRGQKTTLASAFIVTMKNGHVGVMQRATSERLKINERRMVTIASLFRNEATMRAAGARVRKVWPVRFKHHLERIK